MKRVNELDFYSLGALKLAEKLNLTMPKVVAVVDCIGIRSRPDCYKEIKIGKATFKRYSEKALQTITEALQKESAEDIWAKRHPKRIQP